MKQPVVAIVGRPNVGKSTLVNRFVGSRMAIVDDIPGVTRDRAYYDAEWQNHHFTVIDTGGLVPNEEELFTTKINEQVMIALEEADVILFVLDAVTGPTDIDMAIAKHLRKLEQPVILVANKIDNVGMMAHIHDFYRFDLGTPIGLSAMHGTVGVGDLLDKVLETFKELGLASPSDEELEEGIIRLAFAGRPNVGKSSLVNRLLGQERTIVSDIPGTTRDAIDTKVERDDQTFILVDTAGIRKKARVDYGVELFSVDRAIRAIERADVTVLVIDATEGVTAQDKKLVEKSNEFGNALVILVNKWDLVENKHSNSTKNMEKEIVSELPHAQFAPIMFASALTGQRVDTVFQIAVEAYENNHRRLQTSLVNQLITDAYVMSPPPRVKNKQLKIYYTTQVGVAPPRFLLFVNDAKLLPDTYRRYLERRLRENIELKGTPVVLHCRSKKEEKA